jgi:hypothetical protein
MVDVSALRIAIELKQMPSRAKAVRAGALPDGMGELIAVAADDVATLEKTIEIMGRSREVLREGATFFVEQILLAPESDSYRVLGARASASAGELRRNMALLLKVLHPDLGENKERAMFAGRVTRAWEDLKTVDRRQAYDQTLAARLSSKTARPRVPPSRLGRNTHAASHRSVAAVMSIARREQDQKRPGSRGLLGTLMALFFRSTKS